MKTTTRRSIAAALFAAMLMMALFFSANEANAACPVIRNNTPADLVITFYNASGATHTQTVFAFQSVLATWATGFAPIGAQSAGGTNYLWGTGCTACISIPITGGGTYCAKVCPGPSLCVYDIFSCASPCAP